MTTVPTQNVTAGEILVEQGEPAMEAFLIIEGSYRVTLTRDGQTVELATLGVGEIFGETAFFKGSDYGATVTALTDGMVQPISPAILDERIAGCDPLIRAVFRMLMVRLRRSNEALQGKNAA